MENDIEEYDNIRQETPITWWSIYIFLLIMTPFVLMFTAVINLLKKLK